MKKLTLIAALMFPLFTGCIQAGTIVVNAQATVPDSVVKDAAGTVKNLTDEKKEPETTTVVSSGANQQEEAPPSADAPVETETPAPTPSPTTTPTPKPIVKHKVSGVVRRMSGKSSDDLTVIISRRQISSKQPFVNTVRVAADGRFEVEVPVDPDGENDYYLFVIKEGGGGLIPGGNGTILLYFSSNASEPAPKVDLSIPEDPDASVGFVMITVPEYLDNL